MKSINTLLLLCSTVVAMPVASEPFMGDDVVIMRRVIAPSIWRRDTPVPSPTPQPAPIPAKIAWSVGDWTFVDATTCSASARQTRTVSCPGGDEAKCVAPKPDAERHVERLNGCTFAWRPGVYTNYDSTCSDAARRTIVTAPSCIRSDGRMVDESHCSGSQRPDDALVKPVYDGCTVEWATTDWSDWSNTCATTSTRTREVVCQRTGKDVKTSILADTSCTGEKPTSMETAANYGTCTYSWTRTAVGPWSSDCSSRAMRVNTYRCDRSNGDIDVDVGLCGDAPAPEQGLNTDACASVIKDPGFEEGTDWIYGYASRRVTTSPHQGSYAGRVAGSLPNIMQSIKLDASSRYRIGFWARTQNAIIGEAGLHLESGKEIIPLTPITSTWTYIEGEFVAEHYRENIIFDKENASVIFIDDVSVVAVK